MTFKEMIGSLVRAVKAARPEVVEIGACAVCGIGRHPTLGVPIKCADGWRHLLCNAAERWHAANVAALQN